LEIVGWKTTDESIVAIAQNFLLKIENISFSSNRNITDKSLIEISKKLFKFKKC
jgi:hypothetical protein